MSEIIGRQIELGLAKESVRGTAESTASKWVKKVTADIIPKTEKVIDNSTQGVLEDSPNSRNVKKWVDGDLAGIVHADAIGLIFNQIYGTSTSTLVEGTVYDHEFTMLQNIEHPTLSAFAKDGDVYQGVYNEGVVSSLELNASMDDFVRFTSTMIFATSASNADTPSYDTEYDFIGKDISVKLADTEGGLSGATATKIKELSISWDTGAITDYNFDSYNPNLYNGRIAIEGSFTLNYTDDTFKDLFESDDSKYMEISIIGDGVLTGSNTPKIIITLNKIQVQDWSRGDSSDEIVTQEVSFKAFYNETDSQQSKVELTNVTTSY